MLSGDWSSDVCSSDLTADTYVDSLTNEDASNSNIYLNGYKLYVNGEETAANEGTYTEDTAEDEAVQEEAASEEVTETEEETSGSMPYIVGGIVIAAAIAGSAVAFKRKSSDPK